MFKLVIGELELIFTDPEALVNYLKQKRVEFDNDSGISVYLSGYILSPHTGQREWIGPAPEPEGEYEAEVNGRSE